MRYAVLDINSSLLRMVSPHGYFEKEIITKVEDSFAPYKEIIVFNSEEKASSYLNSKGKDVSKKESPPVVNSEQSSEEMSTEEFKMKLEKKEEEMGFPKFRRWAKKEYKVTGRSTEGIIKDILDKTTF